MERSGPSPVNSLLPCRTRIDPAERDVPFESRTKILSLKISR